MKIDGWYYKLATTQVEREIMRVVNYWHPKANAFRDGIRWLVLGTDELQDRLPAIGMHGKPSVRSIQRGLAHLRGQGIIIIEHHRHPFRYGMGKVLWLRPDKEKIGALLASRCRSTVAQLAETNIQATGEQKTGGQVGGDAATHFSEIDQLLEDEVKSGELLMKQSPHIEGALTLATEKKGPEDHPIVSKPEAAHRCLRDACIAAGYPAPGSFNKKRGGQLKVMLARFKEEGVGPEKVSGLIFFIAKKWPEFKDYCKSTFNVVVKGTVPNHDALTQQAVEAVGFWQSYYAANTVLLENAGGHGSSFDEGF
jgi:hypothetical protein